MRRDASPRRLGCAALVAWLVAAFHPLAAELPCPLVLTRVPVTAGLPAGSAMHQAQVMRVDLAGAMRPVVPELFASADPAVSHDGKSLLLAGKAAADAAWQIYELTLATGRLRQITHEPLAARQPRFLSHLFTIDSPEPWATMLYRVTEPAWNVDGSARIRRLRNVKLDGSEPRRVTLNPADDLDPFQAADGRVLYSSQYFDAEGRPGRRLFGVNLDGVDYALYGAEQGRRFQRMPCVTGAGLVVFVENDTDLPDGAGQLASVREARPHHSYRPLTDDPAYLYRDPWPLPDGRLLVSRRAAAGGPAALISLNPANGRQTPLLADAKFHLIQARPLVPRSLPDGRSTSVNTAFTNGVIYALNCYDTDERLKSRMRSGSVRRVRVIAGVPSRGDRPAPLSRRVLGTVPVEPDGSFCVRVPADVPLELEALDAAGAPLATCRWIWVKQHENRGCIGCHEDPERIPENRFVDAMHHPPATLIPPDENPTAGDANATLPPATGPVLNRP